MAFRTLIIARSKPNLFPSILPRLKFLSFAYFSSALPHLAGVSLGSRPIELPLVAGVVHGSRFFSTLPVTSSLYDQPPDWSKEKINHDLGFDFEHWLVVVEKPNEGKTRDDIILDYIKTAASVFGSEEEARKKIYSVSTRYYFAFGVIVSKQDSYKFKNLPGVSLVYPDSYLDLRTKDYGGEPFINGEAVPYDPKYHKYWLSNHPPNYGPRIKGRPRNLSRRVRKRDFQGRPIMEDGPAPNMQPPVQNTRGILPNTDTQSTATNFGGLSPHANSPNYGTVPPNPPNYGTVPPNAYVPSNVPNYGAPNANIQNSAPNCGTSLNTMNMPNHGGLPYRNAGLNVGFSNNANRVTTVPHSGGMPPRDAVPNAGYSNPDASGVPNAGNIDFQYSDAAYSGGNLPSPSREGPVPAPQNSCTPNTPSGNAYQVRDIPRKDYQ